MWPAYPWYPPNHADRLAVRLALPHGHYRAHRDALAQVIAAHPNRGTELVALRAYLSRANAFETEARAGGSGSRSVIRNVYGSLDLLPRSNRSVYAGVRSQGRDPRQVVTDLLGSRELLSAYNQPSIFNDIVVEIPAGLAHRVDQINAGVDAIVPLRSNLGISRVVPNSPNPGQTRVVLGLRAGAGRA